MKVVITGGTFLPREELIARLVAAGMDVCPSVSPVTGLLVCNDVGLRTAKATRARVEGIPVVGERQLLRLLDAVQAGVLKAAPKGSSRTAAPRPSGQTPPTAAGPMTGRRVLVIGGSHDEAAAVRAGVLALGASAAVNLNASVTDVVLLSGGDRDARLSRIRGAGVRVHHGPAALGLSAQEPTPNAARAGTPLAAKEFPPRPAFRDAPVLVRGAVIDLPAEPVWTLNVAWRADALTSAAELDVVAFLADNTERVVTDEDFVFYNAPISEDGAVTLAVDGDSEQSIRLDLGLLPEHCTRVIIAAALSGDTTFGDLGAVTVTLDGADHSAATAALDAGTTERTMLLVQLYLRRGVWRLRAVGQGYDDGLAELATRHGVQVN